MGLAGLRFVRLLADIGNCPMVAMSGCPEAASRSLNATGSWGAGAGTVDLRATGVGKDAATGRPDGPLGVVLVPDVSTAGGRVRPSPPEISRPQASTTDRNRSSVGPGRTAYEQRLRGDLTMATVMVFHEVDDVDHWLASPKREELFGPMGMTARTFIDPEKTNRVGLIVEVPDMETFRRALESKEAAEAMKFDGVRPETIVTLVES